jgi:acetolactate synthase-1/2/3 large subunit
MQSSLAVAGKALEGMAAPVAVPWADWTQRLHASYLASLEATPVPGLAIDLAEVARCVARLAPADTVYTNGAGNHTGWLHRYVPYRARHLAGRTQLAPTSGAMGFGLPAAVAASLLAPGRCVINWAGDGDLLMTGQEMVTAMAHGAGRAPGALISIVVDNGSYGTIRMHQERHYPDRVVASPLLSPDFVLLARAYGWRAERIDSTADFEPAFARALEAGTPVLLHLPVSVDQLTTRSSLAAIRHAAIERQSTTTPRAADS